MFFFRVFQRSVPAVRLLGESTRAKLPAQHVQTQSHTNHTNGKDTRPLGDKRDPITIT